MRRKVLLEAIIVMVSLGLVSVSAQWEVFDCDIIPAEAGWTEDNATTPDGVSEVTWVVDDPDNPGEKFVKVDTQAEVWDFKEQWRKEIGGDPVTGVTLMFRAVALDTATFNRDFDLYLYNGTYRERLISKLKGTKVKFDKQGIEEFIDVTKWHIFRWTAINDYFELYVDDDPLSYLSGASTSTEEIGMFFRFGDGGGDLYGALYDWFAWDTTGAYAPGTGTPLPDSLTGIEAISVKGAELQPQNFELSQNYPNPFNPATEIQYKVSEAASVRLTIHDLTGRLVNTLINETKQPGTYQVQWNGRDSQGQRMPSGVYFYSLDTGSYRAIKKMLLIK
ncbi:MAG: FlgD immunoglobulin-like domain containing protein [Candidatus Neomarinimicrobiota bacterium]